MGLIDKFKESVVGGQELYVFENGVLYAFNPSQEDIRKGKKGEDLAENIASDGYGIYKKVKVMNVDYKELPKKLRRRLDDYKEIDVRKIRHVHRDDFSRLKGELRKKLRRSIGNVKIS
jgi:hypothetical protein